MPLPLVNPIQVPRAQPWGKGRGLLAAMHVAFFPSHQGLQVNSLPTFFQSLHQLMHDWEIQKTLLQISWAFPELVP